VTVAAAGSPEQLCVSCEIRDSGPGFPTGGLARAVRPFVTRRTGRIGLGLTIALTTIRAHGGKLEAENLAAGGATVSVTLPCEPQLVS
jgi:two-component system sensor kinase FixL